MGGVLAELKLAAALTGRLLDVPALRDPFGAYSISEYDARNGWDSAYDHYSYWKLMDSFLSPQNVAMVILAREPLCLTLCGYPDAIVRRTEFSSTCYPKAWLGSDLSARLDLAEPEIELDPGDALVLDGTNIEGLGGLGGGHLVYRFEGCNADAEAVLWQRDAFGSARAVSSVGDRVDDCQPGSHAERHANVAAEKQKDESLLLLQEFAAARGLRSTECR